MAREDIAAGAQFEIGKVIGTSLAVFSRNLVPFGAISAIIGIPYIVLIIWGVSSAAELQGMSRTGQIPPGFFAGVAVTVIVLTLTSILTQSAINFGTFQDLRGRRASLGDCLARGLATLPMVVIAGILAGIAISIGFMLLLVPGIILYTMWWVFVPVIVVERTGIIECFGRSRGLTRGHRWAIFFLLVIVAVAQWLVGLVVGLIGAMVGTIGGGILNLIVTLAFTAFSGVMIAVGYYYLRAEKEGIAIDDIARVFD